MATTTSVTSGPPRAQGVRAGVVGAPVRSSSPSPVGLWYGSQTSPKFLPTADQLINLYQVKNIKKMWVCCDTPQQGRDILQHINANREANIDVYLYIPTPAVREIAQQKLTSDRGEWIKLIADYQPNIRCVCLGNVGQMNNNDISIIENAMDVINRHLNANSSIQMSTIIDVNIIFGFYDPRKCPSEYTFLETFKNVLSGVFNRLVVSSTPLFVKTFPYCAIGDNIKHGKIALDNYLLEKQAKPYMNCDQKKYKYVFDAMVDSISHAIDAMGFKVNISVVSGWPTAGSTEATIPNAQTYNNNLLQYVNANEATPRKTKPRDYFIFSVVDEDLLETDDGIDWKHFGSFTIWKNETFPPTETDGSAEAA